MEPPSSSKKQPVGAVHSALDETSFAGYLEGYSRVTPQDLAEARGGTVRYAIDTVRNGVVTATQYRLGGTLTAVDPGLRYFRLLNPYAHKAGNQHRGIAWSVQLVRPPGEMLRVWYMPPASKDEIVMFRKLLAQLEAGEIQITKVGSQGTPK